MATNLDKFFRSAVGSSGKICDYGATLSPRGDFTRLEDLNAILASWNTILFTSKRSVDHDPEFGVGIYNYLFEPNDDFTIEDIREEIRLSLLRYDDRPVINNISVIPIQGDPKGFSITISFTFDNQRADLSVTVDQNTYLRGT